MGRRHGVPHFTAWRYQNGTLTAQEQIVSAACSIQPVAPAGFHLVKHDENGLLLHWSDWQIAKDTD